MISPHFEYEIKSQLEEVKKAIKVIESFLEDGDVESAAAEGVVSFDDIFCRFSEISEEIGNEDEDEDEDEDEEEY